MKVLLATVLMFSAVPAFSASLKVSNCKDYEISLNSVTTMKNYAHSSIKVFEIDTEEPAAAPSGLAIAINRGEDLSTAESFCRYIPGFYSVDLASAISKYDASSATLTLTMNATNLDENGVEDFKRLTVSIKKGATTEAELVKADLK